MTINFHQKVRGKRVYHNGKVAKPKPFDELDSIAKQENFESDRGRILNSAAIRRLQQKTQVFPLERNAAVRSRLTHSLEVQQVGRYISQLIFKSLSKQQLQAYRLIDLERQIESIVEMSCLMHDIGNPPFGHFGEQAINDWFTRNLISLTKDLENRAKFELPAPIVQELTHFEGNAQAIRLVHTLLKLNLTYTQVSGIFKYTRRGDQTKQSAPAVFNYLMKKEGYYLSEHRYIESMKQVLSMSDHCRSPFSYIMEAADDISYGIADIEDAVEKGILTVEQLKYALNEEFQALDGQYQLSDRDTMKKIVDNAMKQTHEEENFIDSQFFVNLRVEMNKRLPTHACKQFIDNIDDVFHGSFNRALIEDYQDNHALVQTLKNIAVKYAFCHPEVEKRELQGYRIISGLLEAYKPLLLLDSKTFSEIEKAPLYERRLYKKLPKKHLRAYEIAIQTLKMEKQNKTEKEKQAKIPYLPHDYSDDIWEFYFRVRLIQDYISGMTDQYAFDEYRAINVLD
ncbi:dGTPase [Vibrio sp. SS-MA-C1-2]|uniref:dGTPase n=1 Tax=Vibrio sp. SS-MA-C1-2 TaxID=2908646 RepID=UPI001F1E86AE|nr:dGTPase [Vibrio sp. SS-MA-C1-2]UJF18867.1 dGTPase [Vibrio sp. SS-MA-C1-2]